MGPGEFYIECKTYSPAIYTGSMSIIIFYTSLRLNAEPKHTLRHWDSNPNTDPPTRNYCCLSSKAPRAILRRAGNILCHW